MSRRQKIVVIAVLVALVALFSGAVANGASNSDGDASEDPNGFVSWLGDLFGEPAPVDRADLVAACLAGDTLTVEGSCTLAVAGSEEKIRQLVLRPEQVVTIVSPAPSEGETIEADAEPGDEVRITVDSDGGEIVINCGDPGDTCVVTLV
jgi:hypothetical protein